MENLSLFPSKYLLLGSLPNPSGLSSRRFFALPQPSGKIREGTPKTRNFVSALGQSSYDGSARRLPKKGGNILKDQIGLTPEEVISKIMANPEVAMAFQNPGVQAAIMDCSQNPLSVAKYQNEKEVKDVFNKIAELFPGATGSS
ncbi:uncharacterized protein LOC122083534 isoform X2 [Macadamia integrifolia]|uniref:uncharacterized protein LOC122083534 isoform X2 n=1 Tax=Macadamia integrifolia TaxID=60698 RepID=UPI001C4E4D63|nr:uncharacterized protein LOC122083534 isoform X2 [Macadamia integrifolia]